MPARLGSNDGLGGWLKSEETMANGQSIPERAAYLLMKQEETSRALYRLEEAVDKKQPFMRLAMEEAMSGAADAMAAAWKVMDRLQTAADQMAKDAEEERSSAA